MARRYMAEILPIRRKTLYRQSINQSINQRLHGLDDPLSIPSMVADGTYPYDL